MFSIFSRWGSELRSRSDLYWKLLAWIGPLAWREAPIAIVLSAAAAIVGVYLQSTIALLIVSSLKQVQTYGVVKHFPWIGRVGLEWPEPPIVTIAIAVTGLMILAGLARFISRHIAIQVENRIYTRIIGNLLGAVADSTSLFEAYRRQKGLSAAELQLAISVDARFCGIAIRVLLYNVTQLGQLAVGLGILLVIAPVLLGAIALLIVLGILLVYPLNMHAIRISRNMEDAARERTAVIKSNVDQAMQYGQSPPSLQLPTDTPAFNRHLGLMSSRLRVIELSRLTMAVVLAVALGLFAWYGMESVGPALHRNVLPAFVGFYFALLGVQGLAVTATIINRFLPNILRVYRVRQFLVTQRQGDAKSNAENGMSMTKMLWRIDDDLGAAVGCPKAGTFTVGEAYGLLTRGGRDLTAVIFQLLDIASGNKRAFADAFERYLRLREESANHSQRTLEPETLDWIASVLNATDVATTSDQVREMLAEGAISGEAASGNAHFLSEIADIRRQPSPLAFIDDSRLILLGAAGTKRVFDALRDKMLFIRTNNADTYLQDATLSQVFVSDGIDIRCAVLPKELTDAQRDLALDVFFGRIARRGGGAASADAEAVLADAELL